MSDCPSSSSSSCSGVRQIMDAALTLFAARGYEGSSIHAIAEQAGVCKANVFHHFASKEALYLAVLHTASLEWGNEIAAMADTPGNFSHRLRQMVGCILRRLFEESDQSRLLLREVLENGALRGRQLAEEVFAHNFEVETAIFRRAQAEGDLRSGLDPAIAWAAMISACLFFFQARDVLRFNTGFGYADTPERYADGICEILLRGIAAPTVVSEPQSHHA